MKDGIKAVIIGDYNVGKTSLLLTYCEKKFPEYCPTVFDCYPGIKIEVADTSYIVHFWDTAGGEDYDRLRPLSYPQTNVFVLCFSISDRNSFNNCKLKWHQELQHFLPNVPVLLVGLKIDLRDSEDSDIKTRDIVSYKEGLEMSKTIGASDYYECSALRSRGLNDIFSSMAILGSNYLKKFDMSNEQKYFSQQIEKIGKPTTPKDDDDNINIKENCVIC